MSGKRQSTVYDYSGLRLHPDGTRTRKGRSKTTYDISGNYIAKDAAGPSKAPRTRKVKKKAQAKKHDSDGEYFNMDDIIVIESGQEYYGDKKNATAEEADVDAIISRSRPAKRRKFAQNQSYLDSTEERAQLPHYEDCPSSELLKIIHRFSSEFYTERGILSNSTQQYRKEKKERRILRNSKRATRSTSTSSEDAPSDDSSSSEGSNNEEAEEKDDSMHKKKKQYKEEPLIKDMYKAMDGSALVAIGMLLQAHISGMAERLIDQKWVSIAEDDHVDTRGESDLSGGESGRAAEAPNIPRPPPEDAHDSDGYEEDPAELASDEDDPLPAHP